jgi:hypothetical protein
MSEPTQYSATDDGAQADIEQLRRLHDLVSRMRTMQIAYYAEIQPGQVKAEYLHRSKSLEKQVDRLLSDMERKRVQGVLL